MVVVALNSPDRMGRNVACSGDHRLTALMLRASPIFASEPRPKRRLSLPKIIFCDGIRRSSATAAARGFVEASLCNFCRSLFLNLKMMFEQTGRHEKADFVHRVSTAKQG